MDAVICYHTKDEKFLEELENCLSLLRREGSLRLWHKGMIKPGEDRSDELQQRLGDPSVRLIVLLISPDFLASKSMEIDVPIALDRRRNGNAHLVPILVRKCELERTALAELQPLPRNGKPITSRRPRDKAWNHIAVEFRSIIDHLRKTPPPPLKNIGGQPKESRAEKVRQLGAELEHAHGRRWRLQNSGGKTDKVDHEIRRLKREIRRGGKLEEGDFLGQDGRYTLLECLGSGGFGQVWRATDHQTSSLVAIKVLHPNLAGDPIQVERFEQGARQMQEFEHPCVVRVLASPVEEDGWHYFVMEYVNSGNLAKAAGDPSIDVGFLLSTILKVAETLEVAHERGLVHRDIKPENILLGEDGSVKLTDFDLACKLDSSTVSTTQSIVGSIPYVAPESLLQPHLATPTLDVYGLGITMLFALLRGNLPGMVIRNPERVICEAVSDVNLQWLLLQATNAEPKRRFSRAGQFATGLRIYCRGVLSPYHISRMVNLVVHEGLPRMALLSRLPGSFVGQLPEKETPLEQTLSDLFIINRTTTTGNGIPPIVIWLECAFALVSTEVKTHPFVCNEIGSILEIARSVATQWPAQWVSDSSNSILTDWDVHQIRCILEETSFFGFGKRATLLGGISPQIVGSLPILSRGPIDQILSDVVTMAKMDEPWTALEIWLNNLCTLVDDLKDPSEELHNIIFRIRARAPKRAYPPGSFDGTLTSIVSFDEIRYLFSYAIDVDICSMFRQRRERLMQGLPPMMIALIPIRSTPATQLLSDLYFLRDSCSLPDERVPLLIWLRNAEHISHVELGNPDAGAYFASMAETIEARLQISITANTKNHPSAAI